MFKVRVSPEQEAQLDQGQQVEVMVDGGLFILQRTDDGWLHVHFLQEHEVLGFSQRTLRAQGIR